MGDYKVQEAIRFLITSPRPLFYLLWRTEDARDSIRSLDDDSPETVCAFRGLRKSLQVLTNQLQDSAHNSHIASMIIGRHCCGLSFYEARKISQEQQHQIETANIERRR